MLKLTQKDYTDHIEKRRSELIDAWETDKRVKALKTAIKVPYPYPLPLPNPNPNLISPNPWSPPLFCL